jgi:glycosyltransferase involved in cell wall biosynthesis
MPTQALAERGPLLERALHSVISQTDVYAVPIVVVNGARYDPQVIAAIRACERAHVVMMEHEGLPEAKVAGRRAVDAPYFTELDDDDELPAGALSARVGVLEQRSDCDAVVTNGLVRNGTEERVLNADTPAIARDPLGALTQTNWLLPGAWLARTDRVGPEIFDGMPNYLECTWLALRLAGEYRIAFTERPTVVWNANSPHSRSLSREYVIGQVDGLRRILEMPLPPRIHAIYRRRVSTACHSVADRMLHDGERSASWRWHLRSLREPGGWRFLPFTWHLVFGLPGR